MASLFKTFLSMAATIGLGWAVYSVSGNVYYALLACWMVGHLTGYWEGVMPS